MAGDWIKIEHVTPDKPEVVQMAAVLNLDQDCVVGKLLRIWIWTDQQSVNGDALSVTDAFIDRLVFCEGFSKALRGVGWLQGRDGRLVVPNFLRHNGETAKKRALSKDRNAEKRKRDSERDAPSVTKASLEKRREEYKKKTTSSKKFDALSVALPEVLNTSEFRAAWGEWVSFRRQKKNALVESTTTKQLAKLTKVGCDVAVAMIDQSIEKGWTGLFELKDKANGKSQGSANGPESAFEREQRKLQEFHATYHDGSE